LDVTRLRRLRDIPDAVRRAREAGDIAAQATGMAREAAHLRALAVLEMSATMSTHQIGKALGISRSRADQLVRQGRALRERE
jgi:predicted XRE-type DNA-binding protein